MMIRTTDIRRYDCSAKQGARGIAFGSMPFRRNDVRLNEMSGKRRSAKRRFAKIKFG